MNLPLLAALAALVPLAGWAEFAASDPWARASILASRPAAAYLTVVSNRDDRLIAARSPVAGEIMVHATATDDSGVGWMKHVSRLDLSAGEAVTFAPGGCT